MRALNSEAGVGMWAALAAAAPAYRAPAIFTRWAVVEGAKAAAWWPGVRVVEERFLQSFNLRNMSAAGGAGTAGVDAAAETAVGGGATAARGLRALAATRLDGDMQSAALLGHVTAGAGGAGVNTLDAARFDAWYSAWAEAAAARRAETAKAYLRSGEDAAECELATRAAVLSQFNALRPFHQQLCRDNPKLLDAVPAAPAGPQSALAPSAKWPPAQAWHNW